MDTKETVLLAAKLADEKKAEDVKVIDLKGASSLCDYVVIATATSRPHLEAVEEEVSRALKDVGVYKKNRDGGDSNIWRVSDYGNFMLHLMTKEARGMYELEKIFSFGSEIFPLPPEPAPVVKPVKTAPKKAAKKPAAKKKAAAKKTAVKKKASKKKTVKKAAKKNVRKTKK